MKSESESQMVTRATEIAQGSASTAIVSTFVINAVLGFGM